MHFDPATDAASAPGRILIADDEPTFARPLAELLSREGFAAHAVPDAAQAREALRTTAFDLLITDILMPGNAALEFVQELSRGERRLPIILLTGSPTIATAARAVQCGAIAYLLKPIEFDELLPLVRKGVLQGKTQRLVAEQRHRLEQWQRELEVLEAGLRRFDATTGDAAGDFVAMSLNNLLGALLDFRHATQLLNSAEKNRDAVWQANTVQALEKSVEVLERTRRNFKSTELRDLRHELQSLLDALPDRSKSTD